MQSYTGVPSTSRTSPAVEGDILVIGTLHTSPNLHYLANSTFVVAVNATSGDLLWKAMVDPHPLAGITMSPTIHDGGGMTLTGPVWSYHVWHRLAHHTRIVKHATSQMQSFLLEVSVQFVVHSSTR